VPYNLLALLAPASAAWAAYILCRYLSKSVWPAILGGYVFGFSPYFLAQTLAGHLHMVLILPVPIVLYLVARWFDGALESRKMACLAGLAIAAQLLLSLEVFATATMFAGLALLLGFGSATVDTRQRIVNLVGILACAYGLALLIASPFIYYLGGPGHLGGTMRAAEQFSADMLNLLVPTQVNPLGRARPAAKPNTNFSWQCVRARCLYRTGLDRPGDCLRSPILERTVRQGRDRLAVDYLRIVLRADVADRRPSVDCTARVCAGEDATD
jgi:hypothetical protein